MDYVWAEGVIQTHPKENRVAGEEGGRGSEWAITPEDDRLTPQTRLTRLNTATGPSNGILSLLLSCRLRTLRCTNAHLH